MKDKKRFPQQEISKMIELPTIEDYRFPYCNFESALTT